jgi:RNA polymerase sigma factor (sigma-70 family)
MVNKRELLETVIESEVQTLAGIIYSYVIRMGLASDPEATAIASEILSDVVVTALEHAESYDLSRRAIPWLLGIALNFIRRRRQSQQRNREIPVRDLHNNPELSDDELLDRFAERVFQHSTLETQQETDALLAPLSVDDQQILRLAILEELDANTIARELHITPTTARVRLHRALKRLRAHFKLEKVKL